MNEVFLGLGGNMGNRMALLKNAVEQISGDIGPICNISSVYETEAWGHKSEATYYNLVLQLNTVLSAEKVLKACLDIEDKLGRKRLDTGYTDRTMDIDVLYFNNEIHHSETLVLPHPRLYSRKFVLVPLAEIAGTRLDPKTGKTIQQLLESCTDSGIPQNLGKLS